MSWMNQDWEREAELDHVYALERMKLMEQEFYEYEINEQQTGRMPAIITLENGKNKTTPPRGTSESRSKPRPHIHAHPSRKRRRH